MSRVVTTSGIVISAARPRVDKGDKADSDVQGLLEYETD
jgi:hypothetical protein